MGNVQSLSSELLLGGLAIAGGVVYYSYIQTPEQSSAAASLTQPTPSSKKGKKKNAKKSVTGTGEDEEPAPIVVSFPAVIPGQFDAELAHSDTNDPPAPALSLSQISQTSSQTQVKKSKKKKAVKPPATPADEPVSSAESSGPQPKSKKSKQKEKVSTLRLAPSFDTGTDGSWTRVDSRRRLSSSAAGTGTATGDSSPVAERADEDRPADNRRTLAEKMLPKPRKTAVDDMLETPNYPAISRVMRVQPRPDEKPASGFSWGDYEDVNPSAKLAPHPTEDESGDGDGDAEQDENDGWGVVKPRGRPKPTTSASSSFLSTSQPQSSPSSTADSKRARQNAAKRDAQKAAKAAAEVERLATLARHKRELERTKMLEQYSAGGKGKAGKVSGGMKASVDANGKLIWE